MSEQPTMSDASYLRMLIGDTATDEAARLLSDAEVTAILQRNAGSVLLAAAAALDMIALNAVLVARKITTQDLSTDGPAVSAELRALARQYRQQAAQQADEDEGWGFEVINYDGSRGAQAPELAARPTWVPRW